MLFMKINNIFYFLIICMNYKIYTPLHIVEKIFNSINYQLGKKICDHSCGDGNFIIHIARYIIENSSSDKVQYNLEQIYGFDSDTEAINKCIIRLNELIKEYKIENVNWMIYHKNSLTELQEYYNTFDYIIGNPPYSKMHVLDDDTRNTVKSYDFCKSGNTDIYLAFYELSLKLITDNGVVSMITPNSFLNIGAAKVMRDYLVANKSILSITDYKSTKIFDVVDTYTAIMTFKKYTNNNSFTYFTENVENNIKYDDISDKTFWNFNYDTKSNMYLKDICDISVGLATLADNIFILTPLRSDLSYTYFISDGIVCKVENNILKPIIKPSKYNGISTDRYIIFPYIKNDDNKYIEMSETYLLSNFEETYKYLFSKIDILKNRDSGKVMKYSWYAFGRTQGLDTTFGEKIVFSSINKTPNFIHCKDVDTTLYSGYLIKPKNGYTIEQILKIINTTEMERYIYNTGGDLRGGYKQYSKKVVELFPIGGLILYLMDLIPF